VAQVQIYEDIGVGAEVFLPGKKWADKPLEIGEYGILAIPPGLQPAGFHLILNVSQEARLVIAMKNVGQDKGDYYRHALAQLGDSSNRLVTWVMYDPVEVIRAGGSVWTNWHTAKPNRIDCWLLEKDGRLNLVQIGVITNDNGKTFRLLKEPRWIGRILLTPNGEFVAKPDDPKWGPLLWNRGESRADIRQHPEFQKLLETTTLISWNGSIDELYPPLGPWNEVEWRIDWYIVFAGQGGQGIAKNHTGESAWVLRQDLFPSVSPDGDGLVRFFHNDPVLCSGIHKGWGTKKDAPPKLLCVRRA